MLFQVPHPVKERTVHAKERNVHAKERNVRVIFEFVFFYMRLIVYDIWRRHPLPLKAMTAEISRSTAPTVFP